MIPKTRPDLWAPAAVQFLQNTAHVVLAAKMIALYLPLHSL